MAGIALTLGLLLAILVALLAVPLTVMFSVSRTAEFQGQVRFRWLFGLVRFQARIPAAHKALARSRPVSREKARSKKRRKKAGGGRRVLSLVRQPRYRRHVLKFLRAFLRAAHARDLFLRLRIGLGDPADTGLLWAVVGPVAGLVRNIRVAEVRIEPNFVDPVFELESRGQFWLVPIQFLALIVAFLFSPTTLRAWRQLRRENA